jgi:hypothetical protein
MMQEAAASGQGRRSRANRWPSAAEQSANIERLTQPRRPSREGIEWRRRPQCPSGRKSRTTQEDSAAKSGRKSRTTQEDSAGRKRAKESKHSGGCSGRARANSCKNLPPILLGGW